jgi:hypothetical protein
MEDDLGIVFEIALTGYGKASAEVGDICQLLQTQEAKDLLIEADGAASKSPEELFEVCVHFLSPAVRDVYKEALSLKLKERKNDSKLLNSFCVAFSKFVGPTYDRDRANDFLALCKEYFHKNLENNMFTYYCLDDFSPAQCGPGQLFEFVNQAQDHYKQQISEMTPEQRIVFHATPSHLPSDMVSFNKLKEKVIADLRIKIDRILLFIVNSPATPDLLVIIDSNNNVRTAEALKRMNALHQKSEKKGREEAAETRAKRSPAPSKARDEEGSDTEILSHTETHFNGDEEESMEKLLRTALCRDDEIQAHVAKSSENFRSFWESGVDRVRANQFVAQHTEFQAIGDRVTSFRNFHVDLKYGIQVSNNEYIVPSKRSTLFPLSPASCFLSMFAHCRRTTVKEQANATVNRAGTVRLTSDLHINEELVLHNPFETNTARDAKCCQLALDLTEVLFTDILGTLSEDKIAKASFVKAGNVIKNYISSHQWNGLRQFCTYSKTKRPTLVELALSDIVDTVIGDYDCGEFRSGIDINGYENIPHWKRHLNFRSLRAAYNIDTCEDRRVWRYFAAYLDYHRSLKRQNRYCIGATEDADIRRFYSTDYEFLLVLPARGGHLDDDRSIVSELSELTYASKPKRPRSDDGVSSPSKRGGASPVPPVDDHQKDDDHESLSYDYEEDDDQDETLRYAAASPSMRRGTSPLPPADDDQEDDEDLSYPAAEENMNID